MVLGANRAESPRRAEAHVCRRLAADFAVVATKESTALLLCTLFICSTRKPDLHSGCYLSTVAAREPQANSVLLTCACAVTYLLLVPRAGTGEDWYGTS